MYMLLHKLRLETLFVIYLCTWLWSWDLRCHLLM